MSLLTQAIVRLLPTVPKPIVARLSSRYIAGPSLDDAMRVVRRLNGEGKLATIDVLGEEIRSPDEAQAIAAAYHEVLARVQSEQLDANISVKLTGFGLGLDDDICRVNLEAVVRDARERKTYVRIDMEDSSTTDATLGLYRELRSAGYENLGVVLQSRLRRTLADTAGLDDVRLCKGIYIEPEAAAFRGYEEVRASYVRCLETLLNAGAYVGIATHDEFLLGEGLRLVAEHGLRRDQYEFQMLLGVRSERGDELVRDGHRLRIYVPFGTHWYEYSLRRLQENPQIAGYVVGDMLRRFGPGRRTSSSG